MAVIHVRAVVAATGTEIRGSALRTGSAEAAIDHALKLAAEGAEPGNTTKISYIGAFVDPAFTELSQLAQQHGLEIEIGDT